MGNEIRKISEKDGAIVDVLMGEVHLLNDLIESEQDDAVVEELKQERLLLIARVNQIYGTDHIAKGSKIIVMNNSLNNV